MVQVGLYKQDLSLFFILIVVWLFGPFKVYKTHSTDIKSIVTGATQHRVGISIFTMLHCPVSSYGFSGVVPCLLQDMQYCRRFCVIFGSKGRASRQSLRFKVNTCLKRARRGVVLLALVVVATVPDAHPRAASFATNQ